MSKPNVSFTVPKENVYVSHSAVPPPHVRRAPRAIVSVPVAAPAVEYREEWRTRYYGDQFMQERVLVPVSNSASATGQEGLGDAIRGFLTWLLG